MPLLFSPLSENILEGPFIPFPRSAFVMLHSGMPVSSLEKTIDSLVCRSLVRLKHPVKKASAHLGTKDYLDKIIQLIRGCGFGVAIFSEFTPPPTLANIFFEIGLCYVLGKPVIIIKSAGAKPPSDFVRTEWITYQDGDSKKLERDIRHHVQNVREAGRFYENLGDLALAAEEVDFELAFERYRQAVLIVDEKAIRQKIKRILKALSDKNAPGHLLRASTTRLRKAIQEFDKLLP